jgi:hypothetical protein
MVFFKLCCCERVVGVTAGQNSALTTGKSTSHHGNPVLWTWLDRRLLFKRLLQTCKMRDLYTLTFFFYARIAEKEQLPVFSVKHCCNESIQCGSYVPEGPAQVGIENTYGQLYLHITRESSWNPNSITLELDRSSPVLSTSSILPSPSALCACVRARKNSARISEIQWKPLIMIILGPVLFDNNNRLITLSRGYKNLRYLTQFIVTTFYMYKKQQNLFKKLV